MHEPRYFTETLYDGMSRYQILGHIILAPGPGVEAAPLPAHFWTEWERELPPMALALYLRLRWFVRHGACLTTTDSIAWWLGLSAHLVESAGDKLLRARFLDREESSYWHPETGRTRRGADRIVVLEVPHLEREV